MDTKARINHLIEKDSLIAEVMGLRNQLSETEHQLQDLHKMVGKIASKVDPEAVPDAWGLDAAVDKRLAELARLNALVSHLPDTFDKNPEDREPIVPGRRYWVKVCIGKDSWWERFNCHRILRGYVLGETIQNKLNVNDLPSHIFSRHPKTGERSE